jgi:hypothetical protein
MPMATGPVRAEVALGAEFEGVAIKVRPPPGMTLRPDQPSIGDDQKMHGEARAPDAVSEKRNFIVMNTQWLWCCKISTTTSQSPPASGERVQAKALSHNPIDHPLRQDRDREVQNGIGCNLIARLRVRRGQRLANDLRDPLCG